MIRKYTLIITSCLFMIILFTSCNNTSDELNQKIDDLNNEISKLKSENDLLLDENSKLKIAGMDTSVNEKEVSTESNDESNSNTNVQVISIGETIISKYFEFTLNKVELSYKVVPDNPPSFYSYYAADPGQVYVHVDADIKNTAKQELSVEEIYDVEVDYNNGYKYQGFVVVESTDGDFTFALMTNIDPLQTLGVHTLVDCPEEIESDKKSSLKIIITFDDKTKYEYVIR